MCMLCPENQIKSVSGDHGNCTSCDGESIVSNAAHTACGETKYNFKRPLVTARASSAFCLSTGVGGGVPVVLSLVLSRGQGIPPSCQGDKQDGGYPQDRTGVCPDRTEVTPDSLHREL